MGRLGKRLPVRTQTCTSNEPNNSWVCFTHEHTKGKTPSSRASNTLQIRTLTKITLVKIRMIKNKPSRKRRNRDQLRLSRTKRSFRAITTKSKDKSIDYEEVCHPALEVKCNAKHQQ